MTKQTIELVNKSVLAFTKLGSVPTGVSVTLALLVPFALEVDSVRCYAKTAPVGADLIVDVNNNGTTIFTTQANRPTIADGSNKGDASPTPDVTGLAEGDIVTIDVDQVGSSTAGSDLTVEVKCKE